MNPKLIYEKFLDGDNITNAELTAAIPFFSTLEDMLGQCGPIFKLSTNEIRRVHRNLEAFYAARQENKTIPITPNVPDDLTWQNVLNYHHLPTAWTLTSYSSTAKSLGYPYFLWNDRVYDTNDGLYIGLTIDNIRNFDNN